MNAAGTRSKILQSNVVGQTQYEKLKLEVVTILKHKIEGEKYRATYDKCEYLVDSVETN